MDGVELIQGTRAWQLQQRLLKNKVTPKPKRGEYHVCYTDCFTRSKKNALNRNIVFKLAFEDYKEMVITSRGRCAVSGLSFQFKYQGFGKRKPFAPSLDRIDSSKGYTKQNCRLVCMIVNLAMNEWGEEPLVKMSKAICEKQSKWSSCNTRCNTLHFENCGKVNRDDRI